MIKDILDKRPDLRKYLFIRGFMITNRSDINIDGYPFYGNWNKTQAGEYWLYSHNSTNITTFTNNGGEGGILFIAGHAYNPFTMQYEEKKVLSRVADMYSSGKYREAIDELTGIFVTGYIKDDEIYYETDPAGMQSACSGTVNGDFYLTSHPQLVSDICGLQMDSFVNELIEYKWYGRVMGAYLPADLTPFRELKRVVPDIGYTYKNGEISHRRFWPLKEVEICKNEFEYKKVIEDGADILARNMHLVECKWNKPYISLTGGIDSNTTFAAANGIYDKFKAFSYVSALKETIDEEAAKKIAARFNVEHITYNIPENNEDVKDYEEIKAIIQHNNGYISKGKSNEIRKRAYLIEHLGCDVEVKSWVSETIRGYWYKHYGRKTMPKLSPKLFRNLYKIFIMNRSLARKVDRIFAKYIDDFEYRQIPVSYPPADMHYNEVTWGSWGGMNISEMKMYSDITIIYNNRKFLEMMFRVPLKDRISDKHHLDMKKYLNRELYDMNIRIVNMHETRTRAFLLNIIFTINQLLPL